MILLQTDSEAICRVCLDNLHLMGSKLGVDDQLVKTLIDSIVQKYYGNRNRLLANIDMNDPVQVQRFNSCFPLSDMVSLNNTELDILSRFEQIQFNI